MSGDGFLHRYFLNNGGKRMDKWLHYFDIYERHLERFRQKNPVMIEIGVQGGGSLAMWKAYFGAGCKIVGIDIDPDCKRHEAVDIEVYIGSQDSLEIIRQVLSKYPVVDIVVDDGSHMQQHMTTTFNLLYENVSPGGVYVVEDTHACYWEQFEGGLRKSGTFIEFSKSKIDEINAVHTRGALLPTIFTATTDSIVFYDSVVVFEKETAKLSSSFSYRRHAVSPISNVQRH